MLQLWLAKSQKSMACECYAIVSRFWFNICSSITGSQCCFWYCWSPHSTGQAQELFWYLRTGANLVGFSFAREISIHVIDWFLYLYLTMYFPRDLFNVRYHKAFSLAHRFFHLIWHQWVKWCSHLGLYFIVPPMTTTNGSAVDTLTSWITLGKWDHTNRHNVRCLIFRQRSCHF